MQLPRLVAEVLTCQSIQLPDADIGWAEHKCVPPVTRVGKTEKLQLCLNAVNQNSI